MEKQWYNGLIKENTGNLIGSNNTRIYLDVLQNKLCFIPLFGGWIEQVRIVFCNLSIDIVVHSVVNLLMYCSGVGWPWLDTRVPTKSALSLHFSRTRERKYKKVSWAEVGTGRDPSAIAITRKTDLTWGN